MSFFSLSFVPFSTLEHVLYSVCSIYLHTYYSTCVGRRSVGWRSLGWRSMSSQPAFSSSSRLSYSPIISALASGLDRFIPHHTYHNEYSTLPLYSEEFANLYIDIFIKRYNIGWPQEWPRGCSTRDRDNLALFSTPMSTVPYNVWVVWRIFFYSCDCDCVEIYRPAAFNQPLIDIPECIVYIICILDRLLFTKVIKTCLQTLSSLSCTWKVRNMWKNLKDMDP